MASKVNRRRFLSTAATEIAAGGTSQQSNVQEFPDYIAIPRVLHVVEVASSVGYEKE